MLILNISCRDPTDDGLPIAAESATCQGYDGSVRPHRPRFRFQPECLLPLYGQYIYYYYKIKRRRRVAT